MLLSPSIVRGAVCKPVGAAHNTILRASATANPMPKPSSLLTTPNSSAIPTKSPSLTKSPSRKSAPLRTNPSNPSSIPHPFTTTRSKIIPKPLGNPKLSSSATTANSAINSAIASTNTSPKSMAMSPTLRSTISPENCYPMPITIQNAIMAPMPKPLKAKTRMAQAISNR